MARVRVRTSRSQRFLLAALGAFGTVLMTAYVAGALPAEDPYASWGTALLFLIVPLAFVTGGLIFISAVLVGVSESEGWIGEAGVSLVRIAAAFLAAAGTIVLTLGVALWLFIAVSGELPLVI